MTGGDEPAVRITLPTIYEDVQSVKMQVMAMDHKLDRFISLNERLDSHKTDIESQGKRIGVLEQTVAALKVIVAIMTAGLTAAVVKIFTG